MAPAVVPTASDNSARPTLLSLPSFIRPACWPTPTRVPMVSNNTMNRKITTTGIMATSKRPFRSICMNTGLISGGRSTTPWKVVRSKGSPARVVAIRPIRMAPFIFKAMNTEINTRPNRVKSAGPEDRSPILTMVPLAATTSPPCCIPMKAMNTPMPAGMANFKDKGMASKMASRSLNKDISRNSTPETNTAARAACQETAVPVTTPRTTVRKKKFSPMQGARATG